MSDASIDAMMYPSPVRTRLSLLVELAAVLSKEVEFDAILENAASRIAKALESARASIWLIDSNSGDLFTKVATLPEMRELRQPEKKGIVGAVAASGKTIRTKDARLCKEFDRTADERTGFTTTSMLAVPIRDGKRGPIRGVLQVLNRTRGAYSPGDEEFAVALASQLARILAVTSLGMHEKEGVEVRGPFNNIVGSSKGLTEVYKRIQRSARTDASVLLLGETGTGKSLFARAIHYNSPRRAGPFVTLDCTTLAPALIESELFGHERGAFTGAHKSVVGKVEAANGGTLFIDEIGELPKDLQAKLLRFLQEQTFERVGGRAVLSTDVRLVCATWRNLRDEVQGGRFREDLYYRLKVVEISVPPLRERGEEEVERLALYFLARAKERFKRPAMEFSERAMQLIRGQPWRGNVRELEHWVEQAVVLAESDVIEADFPPASARPEVLGASTEGVC
ncbi:MAG: sigma-54-dependent Fis family transcriptional regulator, partial [Polyangiaceae bacterium]|nr:sigma-54-dependent Fis family transcriptional regulator [Polyangiaceae bacterium]